MNLFELMEEALEDLGDPKELSNEEFADAIVGKVPGHQLRAALKQALMGKGIQQFRRYQTNEPESRESSGGPKTRPGKRTSGRREMLSTWMTRRVMTTEGMLIRRADMTVELWDKYIEEREWHASTNWQAAERGRRCKKLMEEAGVDKFGELDEDEAKEAWGAGEDEDV